MAIKGSGIYADNSVLDLNNTIFEDMKAVEGAAIYALNTARIDIKNSQLRQCNSTNNGIITLYESQLTM